MELSTAGIIFGFFAIGVLFHRKQRHSNHNNQGPNFESSFNQGEYIVPNAYDQWFQRKNIGRVRSHECWILVFALVSVSCLFTAFVMYGNGKC